MASLKDLSISHKLSLAFGLLVLLAMLISGIGYVVLHKISQADNLHNVISELQVDLTQLIGFEKKFLVNDSKDPNYFKTGQSENLESYRIHYQEAITGLDELLRNPIIIELASVAAIQDIKTNLMNYNGQFQQLLSLVNKLGFDEFALEGRLHKAMQNLVASPIHHDKDILLQLQVNEKDYFLQKNVQQQDSLHETLESFKSSIERDTLPEADKQKLYHLIATYKAAFDKIVEINNSLGVNEETGIQGQMEKISKKITPNFNKVYKSITHYEESVTKRTTTILILLIAITAALGGFLSWLMTRLISVPIKKIVTGAERFGEGDLGVSFVVTSNDEVGKLGRTFAKLVETTRGLSEVAAKIGSGILDVEIQPRSEKDVLSQSLLQMRKNLQRFDTENKDQVWTKTQLANITSISQGIRDLATLAQTVISELCTSLNAGYGVFYLAKGQTEDNKELHLLGSFAHLKRKNVANKFKFGEGLVGQAALERKPILLTKVPPDYIQISSGLGEKEPLNIYVTPIMHEKEVVGVLELASFIPFTKNQLEVLDGAVKNLGIIINNVLSNQRTEELLKEAQTLTEELQCQQEELRTTNEELEEKTRILKISEEKMKVQSEELQATNEELEEKTECLLKQNLSIEQQSKAIELSKNALEQRAKDLAMASKYKSEFLANMSHELRTPLNSLLILSKNLQENKTGNLTEKQVEAARVIYSGGKELLNLINDILDLSKVEAGRLQIIYDELSVKHLCDGLKAQFEPLAKDKNIAFHVAIDPDVGDRIVSDEQRLLQIIKNLLSNAFKFTKQGYVTLRVSKPKGDVSYKNKAFNSQTMLAWEVIDTGIGIPQDKQEAIFEAFQQANGATNRTYGGTGLGLTISRALAELLGGEIHLLSEEDRGSTFTLYLPVDNFKNSAMSDSSTQNTEKKIEVLAPQKSLTTELSPIEANKIFIPDDRAKLPSTQKSLLVVEDDMKFAQLVMDMAREKGYLCLAAGDGRTAFAMAKEYQPNGIILDLGLPDIDGSELLSQLKFDLKTRYIPVHIISSHDETPEIRQKGAIGYLTKPAKPEDLSSVFNKIESVTNSTIRHVLVVEDDPKGQQAIVTLIEGPNIKIECAPTAKAAREKILAKQYDCIILDLVLPDRSGFELLHILNAEKISLPPIVIYTGRELTEEEHNTLQRYSASIIVKGADSPERLLDELSLFLHSVEADLSDVQKQTIQKLHSPDQILHNKRILLVDDDMRNVFALSGILEERGLDVLIAGNGKIALDKLKEEKDISMILMDIMMPVMDGYEAMTEIRKMEKYKNIPIVALTAKAMPEDKEKCMIAGANDYVTKPVDTDQLFSMMEVWLSK